MPIDRGLKSIATISASGNRCRTAKASAPVPQPAIRMRPGSLAARPGFQSVSIHSIGASCHRSRGFRAVPGYGTAS